MGGLPSADQITDGCFDISAGITIDGTTYTPTAIDNTQAGRTLQGFSTTGRLRSCSGGCPYYLFLDYANFYGVDDYGDKFVLGALGNPSNGYTAGPVGMANGHDMDFTGAGRKARYEIIVRAAPTRPPNPPSPTCVAADARPWGDMGRSAQYMRRDA